MRKHFLILMLLTLLPFTAWAEKITSNDVVVESPYYGNLPGYNSNTGLNLDEHYQIVGYYSDAACQTEITEAVVEATDAGETLYVKIEGIGTYEGTLIKSFQIKTMPLEVIGTPGSKSYGSTEEETIFTLGDGSSIKTAYQVGGAILTLTEALKTKINFGRISGTDAGRYAITASITDATYAKNYSIASQDIKTTEGLHPQAWFTINPRGLDIEGEDATVTVTVSGDFTYNGNPQEATVTVADKIAALNPLTRGYLYANKDEYNAAKNLEISAEDFAALSIAEKTKTPGDYYLVFANNTYAGVATVTVNGMGNYGGSVAGDNFTINPAPLFVIPSAEKVYDAANTLPDAPVQAATHEGQTITKTIAGVSTAKYTFQGFVDDQNATNIVVEETEGEKVAPAWEWVGTATSAAGNNYKIKFSTDVNKGFTLANYTFVALEGTFKITPKNVTAVADNKTIKHGDAETFALTEGSLAAAVNGADKTALTNAIKITKGAQITDTTDDNFGKYPLTPSFMSAAEINTKVAEADRAAALAAINNYTLNAGEGEAALSVGYLTVQKAPLYIGLNESGYTLNKVYDGQEVSVTLDKTESGLTIYGKKGDDVINVNNLTLAVENKDSKVGLYSLRLSGADDDNPDYAITYIPSQFQITERHIVVTVHDQVFVKGTVPALNQSLFTIENDPENDDDYLASGDEASEIFKLKLNNGVGFVTVDGDKKITADQGTYNAIQVDDCGAEGSKYDNYVITVMNDTPAAADGRAIVVEGTVLTLDDTKNMKADLIAAVTAGTPATVTFTNRTLKAGVWYTLVLPFDVTVAEFSREMGYAVVDMFDQTSNDGKVRFNLFMGTIPANTPFMFKVDGEKINLNQVTFKLKDIIYNPTATEAREGVLYVDNQNPYVTDGNGNTLVGFYGKAAADKANPEEGDNMLAPSEYYMNSSGSWTAAGSNGATIGGERAKLVLTTNAREILVEEPDGSTTAIACINADGVAVEANGWYTLDGVKLQGAPTEKGVYIRNGKKMVIK